jgi:hypothetical protein
MRTKCRKSSTMNVIRVQVVRTWNDVAALAQQILCHTVDLEILKAALETDLWNLELTSVFGNDATNVHSFAHHLEISY